MAAHAMDEPRWVSRRMADAIHEDQLSEHGGLAGIREEGAIESGLARPRHRYAYAEEETDAAAMAAACGFGLCRGYGYRDGNKRTAFQVMYVFLRLNGRWLDAPEPEVVEVMLDVASGKLGEEQLAAWIRAHTERD